MRRLWILLGVTAGLLAVLLSACAEQSSSQPPTDCVYWTNSDIKADYMQGKVDEWNAQNPDQPIRLYTTVLSGDLIDEKLWTALHSGVLEFESAVPDLVDIAYPDLQKYVDPLSCLLYPLDTLVERAWPDGDQPDIFSGFCYRNVYFGLPYGSGRMKVVYRESLLNDAGFTGKNIADWQDFCRLGEELYAATGTYLLPLDMDLYYVFMTLLAQKAGSGKLTEETYESTLETIETMYDQHVICLMPGGRSDSNRFRQAFAQGEVACVMLPETELADFWASNDLDADSCLVADVPGAGVIVPSYATAITTAGDHYALMQELMYFSRLGGSGQKDLATAMGCTLSGAEQIPVSNAEAPAEFLERYKLELARILLEP